MRKLKKGESSVGNFYKGFLWGFFQVPYKDLKRKN